ncbi:MAG: glycosyltransferase family 39 protein, partial [Planctomycetota bacterium]|nr:glycosyltransferase family 39 protein [Planctomycetota bacterium]
MPSADRGDRLLTIAFVSLAGAFLIGAIALSTINRSSGSPDSQNFLDTARNIAAGAGFSSHVVQQHFIQQSLPHHENFRPPGAAYVTAAAFRLFGVSLAIPVILNGIVVILAALLLRQAIRIAGSPRLGSLAGVLLLVSGNYSLISVWNNNYLVLCTTALLLCLAIGERRRHPAWVWAICCGAIGALGFLMKPTFLLASIPFSIFLVRRTANPEGRTLQRRTPATVLSLALFVVLTAPYWGGNLLRTGRPIDSPVMAIRLSERYRALPYKTWWTVRFDRPLGYRELVRTLGAAEVLRKEGSRWLRAVGRIISLSPPIFFLVAIGCLMRLRRGTWTLYLGPILLMTEAIFSGGLYAKPLHRYFWPILPCLLYMA